MELTLKIEKLVYGGQGMGTVAGKKVFVPFTVPGESVRVKVVKEKASYFEAELVAVSESSPLRVAPRCPVFGRCGGCQWQHLAYPAQLHWKTEIVKEQLQRIGKLPEPTVYETLPSPDIWNYRNRIQLKCDEKGRVGFYAEASHEVVEFTECLICHAEINAQLSKARAEAQAKKKGIELSLFPDQEGFTQVNTRQNEQLQQLIAKIVKEAAPPTLLELYAGSGNFTFAIVALAQKITAVDSDARAIAAAKQLANKHNIGNVRFQAEAAKIAVDCLVESKEKFDAVLLDPPRAGAADVMPGLVRLGPSVIIYVSCDPTTLARDVKTLVAHGYQLKYVQPLDMFPQTYHVESVAVLERK